MALNFPDPATQTPVNTWSPTSTPSASTNGLTYIWDGEKWGTASGADLYVLETGDTMTGALNVPAGATGTEVPQVQEVVLKAGDTMTGDLTVPNLVSNGDIQTTSLNGGPLAGFRNQIINGDFNIQQRGGTSTTGAVYTWADRWFNRSATASIQRFTLADIPPFNWQAGVSTNGLLEQRLELQQQGKADRFIGTWTLSYWANQVPQNAVVQFLDADGSTGSVSCTVAAAVTGEVRGSWTHYSHEVTMATPGANNIMLRVVLVANATEARTGFTGVQLEPGPVCTPLEHRPIGTELALCQRYYVRLTSRRVASNAYFQLPTTMRATPTGSSEKGWGLVPRGADIYSIDTGTAENGWIAFDAEL